MRERNGTENAKKGKFLVVLISLTALHVWRKIQGKTISRPQHFDAIMQLILSPLQMAGCNEPTLMTAIDILYTGTECCSARWQPGKQMLRALASFQILLQA